MMKVEDEITLEWKLPIPKKKPSMAKLFLVHGKYGSGKSICEQALKEEGCTIFRFADILKWAASIICDVNLIVPFKDKDMIIYSFINSIKLPHGFLRTFPTYKHLTYDLMESKLKECFKQLWKPINKNSLRFFDKENCNKIIKSFCTIYNSGYGHLCVKPKKNMTIGKLLQDLGGALRSIDSDVFVNYVYYQIVKMDAKKIAITDCRHLNEIELDKIFDTVKIKVVRTKEERDKSSCGRDEKHLSETELDNYKDWDYVVENEKKDILEKRIREIAKDDELPALEKIVK